jgi:uncharacterized membrane protein
MAWRDFIDVEVIALVSKHVSGALVVIVGFVVIGFVASWAIQDAFLGPWVHYAETIIVAACVLRAVIVMLWKLSIITRKSMKGGGDGGAATGLVF